MTINPIEGRAIMFRLFRINSFTNELFAGNPAIVCLLEKDVTTTWMQLFAHEMNVSETAFVTMDGDGFKLRWFSPTTEVSLCGHATIAAVHALQQEGLLSTNQISFMLKNGNVLECRLDDDSIELSLPRLAAVPIEPPSELIRALRINPKYVATSAPDYLVEVESETILHRLRPDFEKLIGLPLHGTIVTCVSANPRYDYMLRYFAPADGVDEDPVTGAAHCSLGPFWSHRLDRTTLRAHQLSARGGTAQIVCTADRVLVSGRAVTVWRGESLVSAGTVKRGIAERAQ